NGKVVEGIPRPDASFVYSAQQAHPVCGLSERSSPFAAGGDDAGCNNNCDKAEIVLWVAPRCERKVAAAFCPRVARSDSSSINSMNASGSSAGPTTFTAFWV